MPNLTLYTIPLANQGHWVHWRTDQASGQLTVIVPRPVAEPVVVAELAALYQRLVVAAVIGPNCSGERLTLTVSSPAIPALAQGRSDRRTLYPWAEFLYLRFPGATVQVSTDRTWRGAGEAVPLAVQEPPVEWLTVPAVGQVAPTRHAVEQFAAHSGTPSLDRAAQRLRRLLSRAPLTEMPLPARVRLHKQLRHGAPARWFRPPMAGWELALVPVQSGHYRVVTAYRQADGRPRQLPALTC